MACQVSEAEMRAIELGENSRKYGIVATDADLAITVACQMCREFQRSKLPFPSPLARLWWEEHVKRDAERERDKGAEARQKENDERATLARLLSKYPDVAKKPKRKLKESK